MLLSQATEVYKRIKQGPTHYKEEKYCPLLIQVMSDPTKGTVTSFCVEAQIHEGTFHAWVKKHAMFAESYGMAKAYCREAWEEQGREIRNEVFPMGTISYKFEHWRLMGWSKFGLGKNPRVRLRIDPKATPIEHYAQILEQACEGDFTAGEIKQLMESVNVGLNSHQVFEMQKEIDQLKKDLMTMAENSHGHNKIAD
jgi:hypothetical protein